MQIEPAIKAAFRGPSVSGLIVCGHPLDVSPMTIEHVDGTTVAEGHIAHRTTDGDIARLHYRLDVQHHRLVGTKRRLECASGASISMARTTSPWIGSAEHLIALFSQHLAADPDFDRIEIAFPHTADVE